MIRPALRAGQNVVHIHDAKREVRLAAGADAFLLVPEAVAVRAVVREVAGIGAPGRGRLLPPGD